MFSKKNFFFLLLYDSLVKISIVYVLHYNAQATVRLVDEDFFISSDVPATNTG